MLAEQLVFLVDVDDVDVSFLVGGIQLLFGVWIMFLVIPAHACKDALVRVGKFIVGFALSLSSFEPLEFLIVTDCENKILSHDQQYLDNTYPVDQVLL